MLLTFSTNGKQVYVNPANVAFASEEEYADEKNNRILFTRVYLKGFDFPEDMPPWVDVKESAKTIAKEMR